MLRPAFRRLTPPSTEVVGAVLVAFGVLLWMFVSRGLLIVAGIGAFGPGILREAGWLGDHDEFQRLAARRAGYHAYLVGGVAAMIVLSAIEWRGGVVDESAEWLRFVVVVLWLTWSASTLLMYWGAPKTTSRVLYSFGAFWLVFVVATLSGDAASGESWQNMLLGTSVGVGVLAPFFGLAWAAHRYRRSTGITLLVIAVVFMVVFMRPGHLSWSTTIMTQALLSGPLIVCGLALVLDLGGDMTLEDDPEPAIQRTGLLGGEGVG